jgi:hypothetical protein
VSEYRPRRVAEVRRPAYISPWGWVIIVSLLGAAFMWGVTCYFVLIRH